MRSPARVCICLLCATLFLGSPRGADRALRVPPLVSGGIAGLWPNDHRFVEKEYGKFELLNFKNTSHTIVKGSMTDTTWQLAAMGNFISKDLQFAALARLEGNTDGTLLILFEWAEPGDSTRPHGVFYHTFIGKKDVLIRTKQAVGGYPDTLEFSCADTQRGCGQCFLDVKSGQVKLTVTGKD